MDLAASVLGKSVVDYITKTQRTAVLQIGADRFGRADLAGVACFNFVAAANLSKILNRELQVKNTRDVFDRIHPDRLALPHLGAVSLAVLGAAFEAKGLGGSAPLVAWFQKHDIKAVTFYTLKARDAADTANEKKAANTRRADRKQIAHELRVNRFTKRKVKNDAKGSTT
jgi:hypothetical protein